MIKKPPSQGVTVSIMCRFNKKEYTTLLYYTSSLIKLKDQRGRRVKTISLFKKQNIIKYGFKITR